MDAAVAEEAEKFGDVTVLPVSESYRNISYKAVAIFKWGLEACGARYVVRANSNMGGELGAYSLEIRTTPPPASAAPGETN